MALFLFLTNFAWIAINNVIAGSAGARLLGGARSAPVWAFGLGILAAAIVSRGPRAVGGGPPPTKSLSLSSSS